jgi:hypothetical protein
MMQQYSNTISTICDCGKKKLKKKKKIKIHLQSNIISKTIFVLFLNIFYLSNFYNLDEYLSYQGKFS